MYNPFSKGRWYRFFIKSTGTAYNLTTSDIEGAVIENNALVLPAGYRVMCSVTDINSAVNEPSDTTHGYKVITGDGRQGYFLPNTESFDYGFIYLFVRRANGAVSTPGQEGTVPGGWQEPEEGTIPGGWQEPQEGTIPDSNMVTDVPEV